MEAINSVDILALKKLGAGRNDVVKIQDHYYEFRRLAQYLTAVKRLKHDVFQNTEGKLIVRHALGEARFNPLPKIIWKVGKDIRYTAHEIKRRWCSDLLDWVKVMEEKAGNIFIVE